MRYVLVGILLFMLPWNGWAYKEVAVTNGATLTGKVLFQGTPPAPKQVVINKNPEVCGTGYRELQEVKVTPEGGLQEVVVFLEKVKQGKPWPAPPDNGYLIDQKNCAFRPYLQVVPKKAKLVIVNSDPVLHNIHTYELIKRARRTLFNFGQPTQGMKTTKRLKTRRGNVVRVECDAHNFMLAWIFVADNPYYAVVDEQGEFTITDIPPGTYRVKAWHPFLGFQKAQKVTLAAQGKAEVNFTYQAKE
ncbi:MAG: hypothetical protein D6736_10390 [Nitrospinota bacterium]|nr:MAG: hypothetical protein D6736_10390 [Nitrospinota bacterium]